MGEDIHNNELIYRRWLDELWNKRNVAIIDELFDENGVSHYPNFVVGDPNIMGRQGLKKFVALAAEKASVIETEIEEMTSSGDKVIALCRVKVNLRQQNPEEPDKFLEMDVKCLCDIRFKDGKIVEHWNNIQFVHKDERLELIEFNP